MNTTKSTAHDQKTCGECRKSLPVAEFWKNKASKDGLQTRCIPCQKARWKAYYHAKPKQWNNERQRKTIDDRPNRYRARIAAYNITQRMGGVAVVPGKEPSLDFIEALFDTAQERGTCPLCSTVMDFRVGKGTGRSPVNAATMDHIIPLRLGGKHLEENIRVICKRCNQTRPDLLAAARELGVKARYSTEPMNLVLLRGVAR